MTPQIKSTIKYQTPLAFALLMILTLTACGGETTALSDPDLETQKGTPKASPKSAQETLNTLTAESINIAPPRVISEATAESDTEPTISIKTIKPKPKKPAPKEPEFKIASANISTIGLPPPPPLLDIVTTADWLEDGATSFATAPSPTRDRNEFLQTTGMDLDSGGFATPSPTQRLTLKNGNGSLSLGGDLTDGVAFFTATPRGTPRHYAGIFSGTNLGATLPVVQEANADASHAQWSGWFQTTTGVSKPFVMTVDYANRLFDAEVMVDGDVNSDVRFVLEGGFDNQGAIANGIIILADFTTGNAENATIGIVTGLFGQEGAVGAFISERGVSGAASHFAGGFVATPE